MCICVYPPYDTKVLKRMIDGAGAL
jgi:hypothetical protein